MKTDWRDVDFRPAPAGWRLVYLDRPTGVLVSPLIGWLIQEEVTLDPFGYEEDYESTPEPANRDRRVVPADWDGISLCSAAEAGNFWTILGPGEEEPTTEGEARERERQRRQEERLRQIREERAARAAALSADKAQSEVMT